MTNFLLLLIWMLTFPLIVAASQLLTDKVFAPPITPAAAEGIAIVYLIGIVLFLIIGICL